MNPTILIVEDEPADVPRLLERLRGTDGRTVVFAERTRRSEGLLFRVGYAAYRLFHLLLIGVSVRVGNFSALPFAACTKGLTRLAVSAGRQACVQAKVPRAFTECMRS